jgi:hypothetical protein
VRDLLILFVHLVVIIARLARPGGVRLMVKTPLANAGRPKDPASPVAMMWNPVSSQQADNKQVFHG